jgi:hypothetical protein
MLLYCQILVIWLAQRRYGTYSSQSCYCYVNQARHKRAICFMAEPLGDVGAFVQGIESSWIPSWSCIVLITPISPIRVFQDPAFYYASHRRSRTFGVLEFLPALERALFAEIEILCDPHGHLDHRPDFIHKRCE